MIQCAATTRIACAPAQVFALLDDLERAPEWLDRCVWIVQTSQGARDAGTALRYRYRDRGREGEIAGMLEVYEPDRRIAMTFSDPALDVRVVFELAAEAHGTLLRHAAEITPKRLVIKLLSPWLRSSLRRQMGEVMERLRELAEAGSARAREV